MHRIDEINTNYPFYGNRKITATLKNEGYEIGRERVRGYMQRMGITAIYPKPSLSKANKEHKIYPYLLRGLDISFPNYVWSTDITYVKLSKGFLYLIAVIDWYSRYVLSWRLSNSMDRSFCIEALEEALGKANPKIFNTDQGSQFTSNEFTSILKAKKIRISMDGKGRALDNVFVERLWRTVKYEDIYIKGYQSGIEANEGLKEYFDFYNHKRIHQALNYKTPGEVHCVEM